MKKLLLCALAAMSCMAFAVADDGAAPPQESRDGRRGNPMQVIRGAMNDTEKAELKKAAEAYLDAQIAVFEKVIARLEKEGKNTEQAKKFVARFKENKATQAERMVNPQMPRQAPGGEGRNRPQPPKR